MQLFALYLSMIAMSHAPLQLARSGADCLTVGPRCRIRILRNNFQTIDFNLHKQSSPVPTPSPLPPPLHPQLLSIEVLPDARPLFKDASKGFMPDPRQGALVATPTTATTTTTTTSSSSTTTFFFFSSSSTTPP
jgi:hypothetical protein